MSVDILVIRGTGDRQGEDIEDRLVCDVSVALARGRNELDENSGLQSISITSVLRPTIRTGFIVEVQDSLQGISWRGKVTSVRHVVEDGLASTELQIARPV